MSEITIEYYGHSCFRILYENYSVVFDPYQDGSVPGLKLPSGIQADAVFCSHSHADHNAAELIHLTGRKLPFPVQKIQVPHDDANGTKRGMTDITSVSFGNTVITHMGDIGREPTKEEYRKISRTDVLMIPVGGYFTIDAGMAEKIMKKVSAKLNILVHYRKGNRGYEVLSDICDIRKEIPELKELSDHSISFSEETIPVETITLEPMQ